MVAVGAGVAVVALGEDVGTSVGVAAADTGLARRVGAVAAGGGAGSPQAASAGSRANSKAAANCVSLGAPADLSGGFKAPTLANIGPYVRDALL